MLYELHMIGGPRDGELIFSMRPHYLLRCPDGHTYGRPSSEEPEWIDDDRRRIELLHQGVLTPAEFRCLADTI